MVDQKESEISILFCHLAPCDLRVDHRTKPSDQFHPQEQAQAVVNLVQPDLNFWPGNQSKDLELVPRGDHTHGDHNHQINNQTQLCHQTRSGYQAHSGYQAQPYYPNSVQAHLQATSSKEEPPPYQVHPNNVPGPPPIYEAQPLPICLTQDLSAPANSVPADIPGIVPDPEHEPINVDPNVQPRRPRAPSLPERPEPRPPPWTGFSICVLVFLCPVGLVAILFSYLTNTTYDKGNYPRARCFSKMARWTSAFGITSVFLAAFFLAVFLM
ncbi:uncharacterized protein [Montipora capricornis]|uniref:uncharacterized protein n=1 Tax=Montipora capricornis TaxID=246305 RepID=UPI0035F170AB